MEKQPEPPNGYEIVERRLPKPGEVVMGPLGSIVRVDTGVSLYRDRWIIRPIAATRQEQQDER